MAKKKISKATKSIFNSIFGFENGIDITSEVAVLHRRNVVIKNIIFISNLFYSILLSIFASVSETTANWIYPVLFFPFTFFLNAVISRLIKIDRHDTTKQQIAMYVMAIYVFISVVLVYMRFHHEPNFEATTYVLIYYAIVVISLYQSKPLMLWSTGGMITSIIIIHFTVTYNVSSLADGLSFFDFIGVFIKEPIFYDFLLRLAIFIIFAIVIYSLVSMGQYILEQRKNELIKRREIQEDFTNIVSDLFNVVLSAKSPFIDRQHITLVHKTSLHLAKLYGATEEEYNEINKYANIHLKIGEINDLIKPQKIASVDYDELKKKTELGTLIAKRIQLAQKVDDIARTHIEGALSDDFTLEMQQIQPEITAQIILLCDLYITMRSQQSYKRAYPNDIVIKAFEKQFYVYFDYTLLDRFLRFSDEFEKIYNEF